MAAFLAGVRVFFDPRRLSQRRRALLAERVAQHGGAVVADPAAATVALFDERAPPPTGLPVRSARVDWLTDCLAKQRRLPLPEPEEAAAGASSSEEEEPRGAPRSAPERHKRKRKRHDGPLVPRYACQRPTPLAHHNAHLTGPLAELEEFYEATGDPMRALSFRHAIGLLASLDFRVTRAGQLRGLPHVGDSILEAARQLLEEGRLQRLERLRADPEAVGLRDLCRIQGVNHATARQWYRECGLHSVRDAREALAEDGLAVFFPRPTEEARAALEHFHDLQRPLSRAEAEQLAVAVRASVARVAGPEARTFVAGGFARGKPAMHDLDMLVTHPRLRQGHLVAAGEDAPPDEPMLFQRIADDLFGAGVLVRTLKSPHQHRHFGRSGSASPRWEQLQLQAKEFREGRSGLGMWETYQVLLCLARLPGSRRVCRLDVVVVAPSQWPFATLGWSGSRYFERSIRKYAEAERGVHLGQQGMVRRAGPDPAWGPLRTEEDIFRALGLEYVPPGLRNC